MSEEFNPYVNPENNQTAQPAYTAPQSPWQQPAQSPVQPQPPQMPFQPQGYVYPPQPTNAQRVNYRAYAAQKSSSGAAKAFGIVSFIIGCFVLMIASMIFPRAFLSMGKVLFIALVSVIVVELLMRIFGITEPAFLDAFVALLFCAYIGYDWAKAQEGNHTADEAVDACVGLYLDIINLFIRILSLSSRRSSSRD